MTKPLSHDIAQDLDPLAVAGAELHTSPRRCQAACLALRVEQFLAGGPRLTGAPRAPASRLGVRSRRIAVLRDYFTL